MSVEVERAVRAELLARAEGLDPVDDPRGLIERLVDRHGPLLNRAEARRTAERVTASAIGLGVVEEVMADPAVSDVLVNGPGPVWVEREGRLEQTDCAVTEEDIALIIERSLGAIGVRVDRGRPVADGRLADGSRISVVMPPVAREGPIVAIRRFSVQTLVLDDFVDDEGALLIGELLARRANLVVYGATGSGKTTLLNAIAGHIDPNERIVTVEDAAELRLPGDHVISLEARTSNTESAGEVTVHELVRAALRLRPDRIIVGEVRGDEAIDMVWAMSTGHDGSLSTIHADSALDALLRLQTFVQGAAPHLPAEVVRAQIGSAVDAVIGVVRTSGRQRRVAAISEVMPDGSGLRHLFVDGVVRSEPARVRGGWEAR